MATIETGQASKRRGEGMFIGALRQTLRVAAVTGALSLGACSGGPVAYNGPAESTVDLPVHEQVMIGGALVDIEHDYLLSARVDKGIVSERKECLVEAQDLNAPVSLVSMMRGMGAVVFSAKAMKDFRDHKQEINAMVGKDCGYNLRLNGIVPEILGEKRLRN